MSEDRRRTKKQPIDPTYGHIFGSNFYGSGGDSGSLAIMDSNS